MPPLFCNVQEYKAVEKRLEELERANYLLDDSALEMLARLSAAEGLKALQEFEARMVAADARCPSLTLAGLVRDMLYIKTQLAELATDGVNPGLLDCIAKLSTVEALEALQDLAELAYWLRWMRRIEEGMANMPPQRSRTE